MNSLIGNIQSFAEKAVINKYTLKPFRRDFQCQQSIMSKYFLEGVLNLPEAGFNTVPSLEIIKDSLSQNGDQLDE
ncbi:hypothetical protein KI659_00070 [Litoribacter alkaliphilus]|uniref:Uncharacterized protein n=1 Tax=Litoribacter ruber TaxID=702568 RepID=A0AAP2CF74_9BACT|nr:hypothetical protein [Litoribacter alkaliphilus]MBS9522399.1 hypothetical protein [Litoribacter alkaliphilus]